MAAAASDTDSALDSHWVRITDYDARTGFGNAATSSARARWCCEQLEAGQLLFFDGIPYDFPQADRDFLLAQRQSDSRIHKNISYRPKQDVLRGSVADSQVDRQWETDNGVWICNRSNYPNAEPAEASSAYAACLVNVLSGAGV